MAGRPELETIDAAPPRERIRPDEGYRVGARISSGDAARTRLAGVVAAGIVVAGLTFSALGGLLPATPEAPVAPEPDRGIATPLPDIAVFGDGGPSRLVPVYAGGLRWLDPATGSMSGDAYTAPRRGLFVDPEGRGLCVCLELPWSDDRLVTRVTLRRYASDGEETARATLFELEAVQRGVFGDPISVEAAISRDGGTLWIVHAARQDGHWDLGVDRVDVASMAVVASAALPPIVVPPDGTDAPLIAEGGWLTHEKASVGASIRVTPDASRIAILVSVKADGRSSAQIPTYQEARFELDADLGPGSTVIVASAPHDAVDDPCDSQLSAWATNRHFVTICSRPDGSGIQPFVRIENRDDITREVTVGPPVGSRDTEWLLDSRDGALYRWSTLAHVFTRLDVAERTMSTLALDWAQAGTGTVGAWPAATGEATPWGSLTGPDLALRPPRIVGSADGSVIYALGYRSAADTIRDDRIASTGIWVLDARHAALIAHWLPDALYDEIGFSPGSERLVTVAQAGVDATGTPTDWSSSLRFHDPATGEIVEVLGDVVESSRSGFIPSILVPNAPLGIAGS